MYSCLSQVKKKASDPLSCSTGWVSVPELLGTKLGSPVIATMFQISEPLLKVIYIYIYIYTLETKLERSSIGGSFSKINAKIMEDREQTKGSCDGLLSLNSVTSNSSII